MSFFMVFVSPITFMLIGCVDLSTSKTYADATGVRKDLLPDGIVNVVANSVKAAWSDFCYLFPGASTEEHCVVAFVHI